MKIRLTDDRGVFLDEAKRRAGYESDVPDALADALVDAGLAEKVRTRRTKAEMQADSDE